MNSLDLLLPRPIPHPLPYRTRPRSPALENLSLDILLGTDHPMSKDNPAYEYLSPIHHSDFADGGKQLPRLHTRDAFIDHRADFATRHPAIRVQVIDTNSAVNEARGHATVWLTGRLSNYGAADMAAREAVVAFRWQRRSRKSGWVCVDSTFVHGCFA